MMDKKQDQQGSVLALPWVDLAKIASVARGETSDLGNEDLASERKSSSVQTPDPGYAAAFQAVSERLLQGDRIVSEERLSAPILYAELLGHPVEDRPEVVSGDRRFHSYLLAEMLLERSRESWFDHPLKAAEWARLALVVAERLDSACYGSTLPLGLRLKGYCYLGNALRIRCDLPGAQEAFRKVDELLEEGALNSYERAEVLSLKASFYKDTRRFEAAGKLLEEISQTYSLAGDQHQQGRTMLQQATILSMQGDYSRAAEVMRAGIDLLDPRREPRAILSSWITLAFYYNICDRNEEADAALDQARAPVERLGDRLSVARIRNTEGRINASRGELDEAEQAFIEARDIFVERGISFDAGLASLDLALLYIRQGKVARVRRMAEEILIIFRSHNMAPEIMAAIILFQHAAEREIATMSLIKEISKYLERSREFGIVRGPGER